MRIYFHHTKWYRIHVYQQYQLVEPLFLFASNSIHQHQHHGNARRCISPLLWTALLLMQLLMLSVAVANGCLFKRL